MRLTAGWLLLVALVASSTSARADDEDLELAKAHYLTGKSSYDQGRYEDALRDFKEARNLSKAPALLFNMAACEERLGRIDNALRLLEEYLDEDKTISSSDRRNTELRIAALRGRISAAVSPNATEPPPPAVTTPAAPEAKAPEATGFELMPDDSVVPTGKDESPHRGRTLLVSGVALAAVGAAAALGGGIGFGLAASARADAITAESRNHEMYDPSLESDRATFQSLSIASWIVGGVVAVAGGAIAVVGAKRSAAARIALVPRIAPGSTGLAVVGGF